MTYEIINLEEKKVVGLRIRTNNNDPNMVKMIGSLWNHFFTDGVYQSILNKQNNNSIGLYTNYESDVNGAYDMMACCEVINTKSLPSGVSAQIIAAGRYAKFVVHGDVQQAVAQFWSKLWSMDLDRKYSCDFEEYQGISENNHAEIHIYISLK